ncbi:flagellar basal body L-ring protein FlgH [Rubrivivax albus]|uniref:Flagellar L-ring protein n=2 Tax=Rubrivivax albus TaxID=2499835 RepID=A0A437K1Y6_9BURK|nr:flagellar basal body L-ring protein FlgH [Rubrivivax albus]
MTMATKLFIMAAAVALAGCNATLFPRVDVADTTPVEPAAPAPVKVANGAIFQLASYRPLFEDHRARHVGDILVIAIEEKISASQSANSTVEKSGGLDASISALPGVPSKAFARGTATASSSNTFEGKGSTDASNDFKGNITATVTRVLPNGHLIISGEKQIGVNSNVDVLRFSGQVDPRSIKPGNTVSSTQVANVRLEHRGRGAQAEAQVIGWLARVFLSVLPI